jgi:hypothetical protein
MKREARLSEAEARAIACKAGEGVSDAHSLEFAALTEEEGDRFWIFATASRGSAWSVKIRDRDGRVVEKGRVGLR